MPQPRGVDRVFHPVLAVAAADHRHGDRRRWPSARKRRAARCRSSCAACSARMPPAAIEAAIGGARRYRRAARWPALVGIGMLLLTASGTFGELQAALNAIWKTATPPRGVDLAPAARQGGGDRAGGRHRLPAADLADRQRRHRLRGRVDRQAAAGHASRCCSVVNVAVSLAIITALFAAIYRVLPDRRIAWRDVGIGAFVDRACCSRSASRRSAPMSAAAGIASAYRRGGCARGGAGVDLLLGGDLPAGGGIHARLGGAGRVAAGRAGARAGRPAPQGVTARLVAAIDDAAPVPAHAQRRDWRARRLPRPGPP